MLRGTDFYSLHNQISYQSKKKLIIILDTSITKLVY